jgi:hypothetical protein
VDVPFISSPPSKEDKVRRLPIPSSGKDSRGTPAIHSDFRDNPFHVQHYLLAVSVGDLGEFATPFQEPLALLASRENKMILATLYRLEAEYSPFQ